MSKYKKGKKERKIYKEETNRKEKQLDVDLKNLTDSNYRLNGLKEKLEKAIKEKNSNLTESEDWVIERDSLIEELKNKVHLEEEELEKLKEQQAQN